MKVSAIRKLRRKLAADEPVYGLWVTLESASITEMAVALGRWIQTNRSEIVGLAITYLYARAQASKLPNCDAPSLKEAREILPQPLLNVELEQGLLRHLALGSDLPQGRQRVLRDGECDHFRLTRPHR